MICRHFSTFDAQSISSLRVLPPLEHKDKTITWAWGSIRDADFREVLVTGPTLPVVFSGCRYNNIVFYLNDQQDPAAHAFRAFLQQLLSHVEANVHANPEKFRPGLKNANLLSFDLEVVRPSSYGADLPDELRVKLPLKKGVVSEEGEVVDMIDTMFVDEKGDKVEPGDVMAGMKVLPIFRVGYSRNGTKFGLTISMLKAKVFTDSAPRGNQVDVASLEFDAMDVSV